VSDAPAPVSATGLLKTYGEVTAVDDVDMEVRTGDVYGFLGPNGAGKTTTLRMLLGLIRPSGGSVQLFGRDPLLDGARALDGVAGFVEAPGFYPYLTGRKNLELLASFDGDGARGRIDEVLDVVELAPRAKHRVGGYSHGMKQRLGIAGALLRRPRLLLLDEPATGLDPAGMRDMRALIHRLAQDGITVLLSSHQLSEVEELCNRVGIIRSGRIVYEGTLTELRHRASDGYVLQTTDNRRALEVAAAQPGIGAPTLEPVGVRFHATEADVAKLSIALVQAGLGITGLTARHATLEDLFFRFTEGTDGAAAADVAADAAAARDGGAAGAAGDGAEVLTP
jgi:ABC-2 type transport system ATP-binding protein